MSFGLYDADKVVDKLSQAAIPKTCASPGKLFFGGFAAGAYIALGFLFAIMSSGSFYPFPQDVAKALNLTYPYRIPNASVFKILLGATFPVGLIAVLIGGADLRTGNVQVPFYAKMTGKADVKKVIYNRVTSYGGNFFGGFFVAYLAVAAALITTGNVFGSVVLDVAYKKAHLSAREAFRRGVGCNRLVNVAVRLYARSSDYAGKRLGIRFPIFAFVTIGFEHSIANMRIFSAAVMLSAHEGALHTITRTDAFHNLIPVTLGNAVGGFLFVAFYYRYVGNKDVGPKDALYVIRDFIIATAALMIIDVLPMAAITIALSKVLSGMYAATIPAIVTIIYLAIVSYVARRVLVKPYQ